MKDQDRRPRPRTFSLAIAIAAASMIFMLAASAIASSSANAHANTAGAAARAVFQGPDFWWKRLEPQKPSPGIWDGVIGTVLSAIGRAIMKVLEFLLWAIFKILGLFSVFSGLFTGSVSGGSVFFWLAAAVLLAWAIWKLGPAAAEWLARGGGKAGGASGAGAADDWETLPEASLLFERAGEALRAGRFAEVVRLALLVLIARLERQSLLRYDTARTNREYQRELRQAPEAALNFGRLARIYERTWYGRAPAGRAEAELALALCMASAAEQPPQPGGSRP